MIININDNQFIVKLARTKKETSEGMMGKKFNSRFNGMLFLMGKGEHCFWMKNCICSLDIIFIKGNQITKIFHDCPPCKIEKCEHYCSKGDLVLELKGGTCESLDIQEGDEINVT